MPLRQAQDRIINAKAAIDDETEVDGHIEPGGGQRELETSLRSLRSRVAPDGCEAHRKPGRTGTGATRLPRGRRAYRLQHGRPQRFAYREPRNTRRACDRDEHFARRRELVAHRSAQVGTKPPAPSFKQFASMKKVSSYQPIRRVKLSDAPELEDVLEGADYPTGTLTTGWRSPVW